MERPSISKDRSFSVDSAETVRLSPEFNNNNKESSLEQLQKAPSLNNKGANSSLRALSISNLLSGDSSSSSKRSSFRHSKSASKLLKDKDKDKQNNNSPRDGKGNHANTKGFEKDEGLKEISHSSEADTAESATSHENDDENDINSNTNNSNHHSSNHTHEDPSHAKRSHPSGILEVSERLACTISKTELDFNLQGELCPVAKRKDEVKKSVTDSLTIFNGGKQSVNFLVPNFDETHPKYHLTISPAAGKIKRGKSVVIHFKLQVFCTTEITDAVIVQLIPKQKTFLGRKRANTNVDSLLVSPLTIPFSVKTELSTHIDYDEIIVEQKIASGGFGSVSKGKWRGLDVAIKKLHNQDLTPEDKEMLDREIKFLKKLNCPYIVTYIGSTQIPGQLLCMLMEYVKDGSLSVLLNQSQVHLSDRLKCKILLDVAKGMNFLHCNSIYHRDLKPDNILVLSTYEGADVNVKITDFDTAKTHFTKQKKSSSPRSESTYDHSLTRSRSTRKISCHFGTLIYKAPEALSGTHSFDDGGWDKCDTFSFGVLAWQVFTQIEPYSEPPMDKWSKFDIEKFVINGMRVEIPSSIPQEIRTLIQQCWDQNPHSRPNFQDISERLACLLDSLPPTTRVLPESSNNNNNNNNNNTGTLKPSKFPSLKVLSPASSPSSSPASSEFSNAPILSDLSKIGWCGIIGRDEAEFKLRSSSKGTFLFRFSTTTNSYVLSYVVSHSPNKNEPSMIDHIAYITQEKDGKVTACLRDGQRGHFDNLMEYIHAMKVTGIISHPLPVILSFNNYSETPVDLLKTAPNFRHN